MDNLSNVPGVTVDEGSDFQQALLNLRQRLVDLDGDGRPDAVVPAEPGALPPDPSEAGDVLAAGALGAVDVLGIPSAVAGRVFGGEVKNAMRGPQERNPGAAMTGAVLSPLNLMAAGTAGAAGLARGAGLAHGGMKAMEGARNAMVSARPGVAAPYLDEAEQVFGRAGPLVKNAAGFAGVGAGIGAGADFLDRDVLDQNTVTNAMLGGAAGGLGTVGGYLARRGGNPMSEINAMRSRVPSAAEMERSGIPKPYASGRPVQSPTGQGLPPRSRKGREESADFYADLYRSDATFTKTKRDGSVERVTVDSRIPDHVRGIRETPSGLFQGPNGRWVTHETGKTAKRLGFPKKQK